MTSLLPNANWPTVNLPGQAKSLLKSTVSEVSSARLPKLELPKFSGDLKAWAHFLGSFEMRVHNRNHSRIDKFSYLISLLSCSALAAVQGLSVPADHYNTAIAIIKERFVDLQVLIFRHVEELCNLLPLPPPPQRMLQLICGSCITRYIISLEIYKCFVFKGADMRFCLCPWCWGSCPWNVRWSGHVTVLESKVT